MPTRRCGRKTRSGGACTQWSMRGQTVCKMHGGKAPQALRAAEDRIRDMVDPALNQLLRIVESGDSDAVRLAAVRDVLDRAGYAAKQRIEFSVRQEARRLAEELGLTEAEVLAEAERIVGAGRSV